MSNKKIITVSIIAGLVIAGVIIALALSGCDNSKESSDKSGKKNDSKDSEITIASDAIPGENNSDIKHETTPEEVIGRYMDASDGWYYEFTYSPDGEYDGSFKSGFDREHETTADNPNKDVVMGGNWKLEHGEIKLYGVDGYQQSLWICGDYIVDSQNYFVGEVPKEKSDFQARFICKAAESGDTQIMNFYPDGKFIMEIIRNDGDADSDASGTAAEDDLPEYQLVAGTYKIENDMIITDINGSAQNFYFMDDGIARWVYNKK